MTRCKSWTAILALLIVATALTIAVIAPKAEASALTNRLRHANRELRHARHRLTAAEAAVAASLSATAIGAATDLGAGTPDPATTPEPAVTSASTTIASADPAPTATTDPAATVDPAATAQPTTTAPVASASPTLAQLKANVAKEHRAVRRWQHRVRRLAKRVRLQQRIAAWERHGQWMPIIRIAAAKYHVSAGGMYRMMMRESGGGRFAGSSSPYKGLFQYYTGTWAASWNPYRHDSIYDGSAQIFATAYAIHRGMGAQMWTTTWASQY